jgi:hypothetical protein
LLLFSLTVACKRKDQDVQLSVIQQFQVVLAHINGFRICRTTKDHTCWNSNAVIESANIGQFGDAMQTWTTWSEAQNSWAKSCAEVMQIQLWFHFMPTHVSFAFY